MVFYPHEDGIRIITRAKCGSTEQLYLQRFNLAGAALGAVQHLSPACSGGSSSVVGSATAVGEDNFMLTYSCQRNSVSFDQYVVTVSPDGHVISELLYENHSSQYTYKLAWNATAGAFGLVRRGRFQRFDADGETIGGPVQISEHIIDIIDIIDGDWIIIHSVHNTRAGRCTKVSATGNVLCNDKNLGEVIAGIFNPNQIIRTNYSWNSTSTLRIRRSEVDWDTCSTISSSSELAPRNNGPHNQGNYIYNTVDIDKDLAALLYKTKDSLIVAAFRMQGNLEIVAESSVVGHKDLKGASMRIWNNELLVGAVSGGRAKIFVSDI